MRLIDEEKLLNDLRNMTYNGRDAEGLYEAVEDIISEQPTAYDAEKVIKELKSTENILTKSATSIECLVGIENAMTRAERIVRKGGVE